MSQGKGAVYLALVLLFMWTEQVFALSGQYPFSQQSDGYIVKFRASTTAASQLYTLSSLGFEQVSVLTNDAGRVVHVQSNLLQSDPATVRLLLDNPAIEYVEPNYLLRIEAIPNDPMFSAQYGLHNTGQSAGVNDADIDAPEGWDKSTGNDVIVAVIDTGVDYTHNDLQSNIWQNPGEIAGNGVDDDGNGFIDDVRGWDFANNDNVPQDDHAHGTHVAGIIGASTNNGTGVAGVSWNTQLMALKFIDANGIGTTSNAVQAINYAVRNGAKIINASWGGGPFSQSLFDAIAAAQQAGVMFVAAAGNDGLDSDSPNNAPHYPSSYTLDNVIAVAASDSTDQRAVFSNYGAVSVDLFAPGDNIMSTLPGNQYQSLSGTSMAAPFVSGALAVIIGQRGNLSVAQARAALLDNVDVITAASGLVASAGRLNLNNALQIPAAPLRIAPDSQAIGVGQSITFVVSGGVPPYTYSLSNPATGSINNAGQFFASAVGVTQVIVRDSSAATARSGNIQVMQLNIQPDSMTLLPGQSVQFSASGGIAPYSWQIDNTSIARINSVSGLLDTFSAGVLRVTVRDNSGLSATSGLIEISSVSSVGISPMSASLAPGETRQFSVSGGIAPYRWSVSNTAVASIDSNSGLMTAISDGQVLVSVTDAVGASASSNAINVLSLAVQSSKNAIAINETLSFDVLGGQAPYQWRVSNSAVASIDAAGRLQGLLPGSVRVTVMDASNRLAQSQPVQILDSALLNAQVSSRLLAQGSQVLLNANGGSPPYTWLVENTAVLEINSAASMLIARSPGVSNVTLLDSQGAQAETGVVEVRRVDLLPATATLLPGESLQLSASGGRQPYQWQLSDNLTATVDANGLLVARSAGSFTVTATDADGISGQSGLFNVQAPGAPTSHNITVQPETALLSSRGSGLQFLAGGGIAPYSFRLTNSEIATINQANGTLTPLSGVTGITTLIVTDADGHSVESGQISIQ